MLKLHIQYFIVMLHRQNIILNSDEEIKKDTSKIKFWGLTLLHLENVMESYRKYIMTST